MHRLNDGIRGGGLPAHLFVTWKGALMAAASW
jgi:hypothetical protein